MNRKRLIQLFLLGAAVVMITAGIISGEFKDVLCKAVMICMECAGIG